MAAIYQIGLFGNPTDAEATDVTQMIANATQSLGLTVGNEVSVVRSPADWKTPALRTCAAAFFVAPGAPEDGLSALLEQSIPFVPVLRAGQEAKDIPASLSHLNALDTDKHGNQRLASALLESASLLPAQRRVFLSYRRAEAREAALQLFDALSERHFDVFLDTHGVPPAADFQDTLWHRLCDSDVLIMLDTPGYFESRWTAAEFGRALAKSLTVLRVGWPGTARPARSGIADNIDLGAGDIDLTTGRLTPAAIEQVCLGAEVTRSEGLAIRRLNFLSRFRQAVEQIGGSVSGVGPHHAVHVSLPGGKSLTAYASLGIPNAVHLHQAHGRAPKGHVAVVFDPVGVNQEWLEHLDWLGSHITPVKWVKSHEAAWALADWV